MNPLVNSLNLYKSEKSIYGAIMICATLIGFSKLLMLANVLGVSEFGKYVLSLFRGVSNTFMHPWLNGSYFQRVIQFC